MERARLGCRICVGLVLAGWSVMAAERATGLQVPLALRAANPDQLSSGLFGALDAAGAFGASSAGAHAVRAGLSDSSKGKPPVVLDPRVAPNVRVGDDPSPLPSTQIGQAEPHIYRSAAAPNVLLSTFQEGRFSDSGALDCGYGVSMDGGFSWTRGLIPQLTTSSGGTYSRATDPVAAVGPQGDLYLNTLVSTNGAFATAAIVVSRSTDNGSTWSAPSVVYQSTSTTIAPDKNWMAVNDYPGTAHSGRLVVTWTNFTSNASGASTGNNLLASYSDDRGQTWSAPAAITPAGAANQGSQPAFLPDGSLAVVYTTFPNPAVTTSFTLECKRSADGGTTFPSTSSVIVSSVNGWDDPDLRDGVFLSSAAAARQTGDLFVTYTAVVGATPRVLVARSSDKGASWTTPVIASDNPTATSVVNPAVAASPDGRSVTVVFQDKRNATDQHNFVDTYAAISADGGTTWQPNLRLSDLTSDVRHATATARGYMLGDYLGVAPSTGQDPVTLAWNPCVAIWCDTRTGDADPFTARFSPGVQGDFATWSLVRNVATTASSDSDADGELNLLEYTDGTEPTVKESGEDLYVRSNSPGTIDVAWTQRALIPDDRTAIAAVVAPDLAKFVAHASTSGAFALVAGTPLSAEQLPKVQTRSGLGWTGYRYTVPSETLAAFSRTVRVSDASGPQLDGPVVPYHTDARLVNVATRGGVGTNSSQMIAGFVIDGPKTLLLRVAGPTLAGFGIADALQTPALSLSAVDGTFGLSTNVPWQRSDVTSDLFVRLGAFPLQDGSADIATLQPLTKGNYTAIVSGTGGATGTALVEVYDADPVPGAPIGPRLLNLSTRGMVTPANPLIVGFVINGTQPRRVLIRAGGPALTSLGVTGPLADPALAVYLSGGKVPMALNDDWEISRSSAVTEATASAVGAFPFAHGSLDAALVVTLAPGGYTATVTGVNGTSGVAIVEIYDAD